MATYKQAEIKIRDCRGDKKKISVITTTNHYSTV